MNIKIAISHKIKKALLESGAPHACEAQVRQSTKKQFGDYQVNGVISLAKKLCVPPRELAKKVLQLIDLSDMAKKVEIAGPGFINIFLNSIWVSRQIDVVLKSPNFGVTAVEPQTIVIDYSGPNVAKEMHVGHLRSTIIGDASARTLEFLGHNVIRANHIGDWGTQFGMLIAYLEKIQNKNATDMDLCDLEAFYRQAKKHYDEDSKFAALSSAYVVKLQGGDPYCKKMWGMLVDITMKKNQIIYDRLNVTLTKRDIMGESHYNSMLPGLVSDLKDKGLAVESEGCTVVFLDEYHNKKGKPMGVIIQKKDGGYLYATTDLACAKYRYETLGANRILYYTDSRQNQHLIQTWAIVRKAGYIPPEVSLEHHFFGMMLGKDGKPFRTRSGETVKLSALLDEAIERATRLISSKNPNMSEEEVTKVASVVGIGAVKYADLSRNRTTDYIFDWDHMLSLEGNTAPYMQYAYSRIMSIFRRAEIDQSDLTLPLVISEECELTLGIRLLQFEETLISVARGGAPHIMCSYLYDLAGLFSKFYENCNILNAENETTRQSRLKLALLTSKILKHGLDTLGIGTVERM